ncbi:MAG: type II toxin-antitoxin system VapC family toxin [Acidimicrobiales bacterium]
MIFLLDTHVWLWMLREPERLPDEVRTIVEDGTQDLLLSAASSWEIAIKYTIGRLHLPSPPATYIPDQMLATAVQGLGIEHSHALEVASLPHHHSDPFDRMLIAQSIVEDLTILTVDTQFSKYDIRTVGIH